MARTEHPYIEAVFTHAGSATIAAAGTGLGLLLTEPYGAVAEIVGAAVGAAAGLLVARIGPQPEWIERAIREHFAVEALLIEKFRSDLSSGFINEPGRWSLEMQAGIKRLKDGGVLRDQRPDERFSREEAWPNIQKEIPYCDLESDLRTLHNHGPITICSSCIMVGATAALLSICRRFDVRLKVDCFSINGAEQALFVAADSGGYDFVCIALDPFVLHREGDPKSVSCSYRRLAPINSTDQYVYRRMAKSRIPRNTDLWVYPNSTADLQCRIGLGIPLGSKPQRVEDARKIVPLREDLGGGDHIVVWEPLAAAFRNSPDYEEVSNSRYPVVYYLFCHKSWMQKNRDRERRAFIRVFCSEWLYCSKHRHDALSNLRGCADYMRNFKAACGL